MRGLALSLRVAFAGFAIASVPAFAGDAQVRRGFWASFGVGYGSAQAWCDQCVSGSREGSAGGTLRLGGTIGEHWRLGWEGSGWLKNNDTGWLPVFAGTDRTLGNSSVIALYYPVSSSGFFVRAGAGVSYAGFAYGDCIDDGCYVYEAASGVGLGATAGIGYDLRIGRKLSLTPEVSYARGFPRDLSENGITVATGWSHDIRAVNLCLTFH